MSNTVFSREFYLPWAYQPPTWPDTPWGEVANDTSGPMQQHVASSLVPLSEAIGQHDNHMVTGFAAAPPFNEATVPNSYNESIIPPSDWMNAIDTPSMAQQAQTGHLQVIQPEQRADVVNTPAVIHDTVGTPAILAASERRRTRPRKYACHICGNGLTTKANRDCHVRSHYGIKPFVCPCGTAFTAKADLTRHRKAAAARFTSASDASLLCIVSVSRDK